MKLMNKKYLLVDFYNLVFRTRHTVSDIDMQIGLSLHTFFTCLNTAYSRFKPDHIVVCSDNGSWRYDRYPDYKLNRKLKELTKSTKEKEEDKAFFEAVGELWKFLEINTNVTTLKCKGAEADDMIAIWTEAHPDDVNIILSTDEDYFQLINDKISCYNGTKDVHATINGYFDSNGLPVVHKDGTTKPDPEFSLFLKCIRGDSDNILSSYPNVRLKSTKKKIGIIEAYEDRINQGFSYTNFFNQVWKDHNDNDVVVKDRFLFNMSLMDLRAQPDYIKTACIEEIFNKTSKEPAQQVGIHFMKFCGLWSLDRISQSPSVYATFLNKGYA